MFSKINFRQYAETRKAFYDRLSDFALDPSQISEPIQIDLNFIDRINTHFNQVLNRRLEKRRFSKAENKEYKDLIPYSCDLNSVFLDFI